MKKTICCALLAVFVIACGGTSVTTSVFPCEQDEVLTSDNRCVPPPEPNVTTVTVEVPIEKPFPCRIGEAHTSDNRCVILPADWRFPCAEDQFLDADGNCIMKPQDPPTDSCLDVNYTVKDIHDTEFNVRTRPFFMFAEGTPAGLIVLDPNGYTEFLQINISASPCGDVVIRAIGFTVWLTDTNDTGWPRQFVDSDVEVVDVVDPSTRLDAQTGNGMTCSSGECLVFGANFLAPLIIPAGGTRTFRIRVDTTNIHPSRGDTFQAEFWRPMWYGLNNPSAYPELPTMFPEDSTQGPVITF